MTGLEFNAELTPLKDLLFKIGYTYNKARDKSQGALTEKVTNAPKNIVNARIQYTVPHVGTRLDFNMVRVGKSYSQLPTPQNPNDQISGHSPKQGLRQWSLRLPTSRARFCPDRYKTRIARRSRYKLRLPHT